jgi:hypothetical protein
MCICCILVETDGKQIGIFETACQKYSWSRRTEDVGLFGSKTIDSQKKWMVWRHSSPNEK